MTDLRQRFAEADQLRTPDVWADVESRSRQIAEGRAPRFTEPARPRGRVLAGIVAFAVFAAAAAFAWTALRPDGRNVPSGTGRSPLTYRVPKLGLQFSYPRDWHVQPFDQPDLLPESGPFFGALVSNLGGTIRHPDLGRDSATSAWDMRAYPARGVVISIERIDDVLLPTGNRPDTSLPLSLADARRTHSAYSGDGAWVWRPFRLGGLHINFRVWFGPKASRADRRTMSRIVASIQPIGVATTTTAPNYVFDNVRVTGYESLGNVTTHKASIGYAIGWTTQEYPGVHRCTMTALDAEGSLIDTKSERWLSLSPGAAGTATMYVSRRPSTVTVTCHPRRIDTAVAFVIDNVRLRTDGGTLEVVYDVSWPAGIPAGSYPGTNDCQIEIKDPSGATIRTSEFTFTGGRENPLPNRYERLRIDSLPQEDRSLKGLTATVTCVPYTHPSIG